jgi:antitoxin ParD1/3/4
MATLTFTIPDEMAEWIEEQVRKGEFASVSDYLRNVVRHDHELRDPDYPLTLEELRDMISEARAGGVSDKSIDEVFEDAQRIVAERRGRVA